MDTRLGNIFEPHYNAKECTARGCSSRCQLLCCHSLDRQIALVDCHLIHGAEIMIRHKRLYEKLGRVQKNSLRQILRVNSKLVVAPLLGIWSIRHRRLSLALKYLDYLLQLDPAHLAREAAFAAHALFRAGHSGWIGDLDLVLFELAKVRLPDLDSWSSQTLRGLESRVRDSVVTS
jgi:hypothetical protein